MNDDTQSHDEYTIAVPERRLVVPIPQQLMILGAILLLIFGGTITTRIVAVLAGPTDNTQASVAHSDTTDYSTTIGDNEEPTDPFDGISVAAEAAYVFDVANQRALYKKNETEILPLASITKLMTALVADEVLSEQATIRIGDTAVRQDGDSGLAAGETFTREALLDLTLMSSSNDGAYAIAATAGAQLADGDGATAFVKAMNIRAKEIGLHDTTFRNPTGLDLSPTQSGANGTAKDVAFLMEYLVKHRPDILTYTTKDIARVYSAEGTYHDAENTNYYLEEIPGLIASKTGYTELAGGNLVIAFDAGLNRPIVIAVLGSTRTQRFTDVITLADAAQVYVSNTTTDTP